MGREERLDFALKFPSEDNYMIVERLLAEIFIIVGWKPFIDMCCNSIGSNSCAPFFYCAQADGLKQARSIAGKDVLCNPPYDLCLEFYQMLIDAYKTNDCTRALLIVPVRPTKDYYILLEKNPKFTMVAYYTPGTKCFTAAIPNKPLAERRVSLRGAVEAISVWELNKAGKNYATMRVDKLIDWNTNIVSQVVA